MASPKTPPAPPPAPKANGNSEATAAPANTNTSAFQIDTGISVPPMTRGAAAAGGETYPFEKMDVNQSFLVAIQVPENITDEKERTNAFNEEAKTIANRLGGAVRRFKNREGNSKKNFAVRKVNDDARGRGVRVWRVEDSKDEAPAPAAAA